MENNDINTYKIDETYRIKKVEEYEEFIAQYREEKPVRLLSSISAALSTAAIAMNIYNYACIGGFENFDLFGGFLGVAAIAGVSFDALIIKKLKEGRDLLKANEQLYESFTGGRKL